MRYKILVAEDDEDIIDLLKVYLESSNFEVMSALNGTDALEIVQNNKIDLAVLDIMMPKMNGYELTKKIREISNMPIIILSAKNHDTDKIFGLNVGADDYLTKPFNPLEIIARVNANLRRCYNLSDNKKEKQEKTEISVGELIIDTDKLSLTKNGVEITLTPTEYKILLILMKSPGRIFTKVQLYENINGEFFETDDNTMMVHISKIREKIEDNPKKPKYIKTVRGLGYKIENEKE